MSRKKPKRPSASPPPKFELVAPRPLSEEDLDELGAFLDSDQVGPNTMRIDALHGFATAILIGPDTILPSVWIPHVWGPTDDDEPAWKNDKQFSRIMKMIFSLCNEILERFEIEGEEFEPLLMEGEHRGEKYLAGEAWSSAFMQGTGFWSQHLETLLAQPEGKALDPIMKLARATFWVTPAGYYKGIKKRQTYVAQLPDSVATLYEYFMPIRSRILDTKLALEAAQPGLGKPH
jgi:uncharacterized protein